MKVADYILDFIIAQGVKDVFGLIGGTCGILFDSMGEYQKRGKLRLVPLLHEQSVSMAVEGYARIKGFGAAIVSSGPATANIMTGVLGAFHESIPCLFIAGQQDTDSIYYEFDQDELKEIRQIGTQEGPHVQMLRPITKYAALVKEAEDIRFHLEKAIYLAKRGRPGPVFLDIPKNLQGFSIDPENLRSFNPATIPDEEQGLLSGRGLEEKIEELIRLVNQSKRPVILLGAGIRLSGTAKEAKKFAERLGAPVVLSWGGLDAFPHAHEAFIGSIGDYATRAGNFTVQNCDLLIALGSRLDPRQTTKEFHWFARGAKVAMINLSHRELEKKGRKIDLPIRCDLRDFFPVFQSLSGKLKRPDISEWYNWVQNQYKAKYPVVLPEDYQEKSPVNPRAFIRRLSELMPEDGKLVTDCGINHILIMTCFRVKEGQRAFANGGSGALGFALPAAIGMSYASGKKPVVAIMGDGGAQFNIQELQTLKNHGVPVKVIVLNNKSYGLLVNTQDKSYGGRYVGSITEPNGYSAPDFTRIAEAYGLRAVKVLSLDEADSAIIEAFDHNGPVLVEVILPEGKFPFVFVNYGDPLEDSRVGESYLPVEEMRQNMKYVPPLPKTLEREKESSFE
jgi:acetolactate synthase-1/2/3 large subunit